MVSSLVASFSSSCTPFSFSVSREKREKTGERPKETELNWSGITRSPATKEERRTFYDRISLPVTELGKVASNDSLPPRRNPRPKKTHKCMGPRASPGLHTPFNSICIIYWYIVWIMYLFVIKLTETLIKWMKTLLINRFCNLGEGIGGGNLQSRELDLVERVPEELWMEARNLVQEGATETIPKKRKGKRTKAAAQSRPHKEQERRRGNKRRGRQGKLQKTSKEQHRRGKRAFLH